MNNLYFIDNHTHGAFGINFNYANYDEIKFLLKEFYKRNIRGVCPTLVGDSDEMIQKQLWLFEKIKSEQEEFSHNEALILGVHLEGTFLNPQKSGIQDNSVFKMPTKGNFDNLAGDFMDIIKIVTIAPELDIDLIDYLNENNIKTQAGHTTGNSLKKCKGTTHHFNAMNPIHHRTPSIVLEGILNDNVYCEIIADMMHCSVDILKLFLKNKSKDRILLISDSLPCAHFDEDIVFCSKKIDSQGKDEQGVIAGSIKTLDEICMNLIEKKILSENDVRQMAFLNQIEYLNLDNKQIDILNK